MSTACCHGSSTSIWPSTPPRAAKRSPRLPTNNSTGVGLHATTRRSWISARCNARPPTPPATTARCGTNACRWQRNVAERPVKAGRTRIRPRYLNYLHLECGGRIALRRRPEGDIWQGLYDLPAIESDRLLDFTELAAAPPFRDMFGTLPYRLVRTIRMPKHQLSHQTLHAAYHRLALDAWPSRLPEGGRSCRTNSWRTMRPALARPLFRADRQQR